MLVAWKGLEGSGRVWWCGEIFGGLSKLGWGLVASGVSEPGAEAAAWMVLEVIEVLGYRACGANEISCGCHCAWRKTMPSPSFSPPPPP